MFSFGAWINQRRRSLRLTQHEVAHLIGCSVVLIRKIESDERRPSLQIAERLARALHIPPDDSLAFVQAARANLAPDRMPAPASGLIRIISTAAHQQAQGHVPQQISSFYGREHEIADLRMLLQRSGVRLVTLTGPGGIGKTRLALEVAYGLQQAYPNGVWFIDLAAVSDPQQVAKIIAQACGVPEQPAHPPAVQLIRWLRSKQLLLIVDNYEHVIDAATLMSDILRAAVQVQILVTSRVSLRLTGEHEYVVPPLALGETESATTLPDDCAAMQLFVDRARAVYPAFQLSNTTAPVVSTLCRRLGGLPLAIELAAARMRVFAPEQLLERIQTAILPLLDGGKRDLPARHQTMRATIAWSYQLLIPAQRRLLARLSIFMGGWTLEAAEVVGSLDGLDVIEALEDLVEHSLIQRVSIDGWPRFAMLELIREYAREQLAIAQEEQAVQRLAALHMLEYAQQHVQQIDQSEHFSSSRLLLTEHENLRTALEWLFEADPHRAFQLACTLWKYWNMNGKLVEAAHWLNKVLEQIADPPALLRAYALDRLGWCLHLFDENDRAIALFQESAALYESQHDTLDATFSTMHLCLAYRKQCRFDLANQVLDHCLPIFRSAHATYGIAWCLFLRGLLLMDQGQLGAAWTLLHEARGFFQQCNDHFFPDWICYNLGHIARLRGELDLAEQLYTAALRMLAQARDQASQHEVQICLGHLARLRGQPLVAAAIYTEELKPLYAVGNRRRIADALDGLGGVFMQLGHANAAVQMISAASHLREVIAIPLAPAEQPGYQRIYAELRGALPEPEWNDAWEAGRAMSLDVAIAEALRLAAHSTSSATALHLRD